MAIGKLDPKVQIASAYAAQRRVTRRPAHKFALKFSPYEIQPFLLAPVLPGESLTQLLLQAQVWSDPLKPTLRNIGWWLHYDFFYVKHRDLVDANGAGIGADLAAMMLNPEHDMGAYKEAANRTKTYAFQGGIDFATHCLKHVVEHFYRDEGEAWNHAVSADGLPLARVYGRGQDDAFERLTLGSDYKDEEVELDLDGDGKITMSELEKAWGQWAAMRDAGLTDMDYEDYIRTFGVSVREDEKSVNLHRAEIIGQPQREFTYPTNTVDPTTGVPSTAVGWRIQKDVGKRIFCTEPGFIFGVMYARPKIYLKTQIGSVAGSMTDVFSWLPALLHNQHDIGHKFFADNEGPLEDAFSGAQGYWVDLRDLLINGDQFVNFTPGADDPHFLALPAADGRRRYAAAAELSKFFATEASGNFDADGIVNLSVLGRQTESLQGRNVVLGKR